jgi:pilus assembly protein CpaB
VVLYRLIASRATTAAAPAVAQVIVASRNLELGTLLKESDLKMGNWSGALPKGAVARKEDIVGRGVISTVYQNEPVVESRLAAKGAGAGLAAMIPAGMRAFAVRVNEVVGVAGFVVPGMRVDVLISGNPPNAVNNNMGTVARTLLQNVEVLSAGQNFQKDAEGKPIQVQVVNLLVTPDQCEILSLATNETRVQLVLRNPMDTDTTKTKGTAMANLFSGRNDQLIMPMQAQPRPIVRARRIAPPAPQQVKEKPAPPVMVEVFNGSKRMEAKFAPAEDKQ